MAYIIGTKRPETQGEPQQLVSGTPSMLGQGSTGVQAQTGQAAPSTFTNLQRYIEANQGNVGGLAQAIESKKSSIENPFQQAKTEAEIAKQNVQSAIEGRGQAESSLKAAVEKARTAPSTLGAEEVKNIRNLATTFNYDPSQVLTPLTTAVAGLGGKAQTSAAGLENLATREGQRQALIEARQAPRSSLGGLELDTFLLGASPEAQSRVQALNLPTRANELRQALTPFQENITEFQKTKGLTSADIQNLLTGQQKAVASELETSLPSLIEEKAKQNINFGTRLARRQALPGEIENLRTQLGEINKPSDIDLLTSQQQRQNMLSDFFSLATPENLGASVSGSGGTVRPTMTETETAKRERLRQAKQNEINALLSEQEGLSNLEKELATQKAGITYGQALSPEQIARYTAFAQLAGLDPTQFLGRVS
jgi:hypothetical protein